MTTQQAQPIRRTSPRTGRPSEAGSAYLATLLVLVVLTILGLSLAVITQTEVLIGGSEKQATRQLFNANSGINIATATEMVSAGSAAHKFTLPDPHGDDLRPGHGRSPTRSAPLPTSRFTPASATSACSTRTRNSPPSSTASRVKALRRGDTALASSKSLGAVIALEPWKKSISGFQLAAEERLQDPTTPVVDWYRSRPLRRALSQDLAFRRTDHEDPNLEVLCPARPRGNARYDRRIG